MWRFQKDLESVWKVFGGSDIDGGFGGCQKNLTSRYRSSLSGDPTLGPDGQLPKMQVVFADPSPLKYIVSYRDVVIDGFTLTNAPTRRLDSPPRGTTTSGESVWGSVASAIINNLENGMDLPFNKKVAGGTWSSGSSSLSSPSRRLLYVYKESPSLAALRLRLGPAKAYKVTTHYKVKVGRRLFAR